MNNRNIKDFLNTISSLNNPKDIKDFFEGILTPNELSEISTRLQIIKLLKQGVTQREISRRLKVGIATIGRGSREIKRGKFKKI